MTSFSTPVPFAALTAGTTNLLNLIPGTTYYLRIRAENNDTPAVMTVFSSTASIVTLGSSHPDRLVRHRLRHLVDQLDLEQRGGCGRLQSLSIQQSGDARDFHAVGRIYGDGIVDEHGLRPRHHGGC